MANFPAFRLWHCAKRRDVDIGAELLIDGQNEYCVYMSLMTLVDWPNMCVY